MGEVHGVAGEERGVVGYGDAGDFQVLGADADSALLELVKQGCRFLIEGEDQPVGEQRDLFLQARLDRDLPVRVIGAVEQREPTAKVLLDGDPSLWDLPTDTAWMLWNRNQAQRQQERLESGVPDPTPHAPSPIQPFGTSSFGLPPSQQNR
ncbi:MAG: hypothetical protein JHD23_08505 [Akkermansiaceae bacterium]|nr:hypothetical protein [Akkermansiaceae bacterium]MBJ7285503.1 hypothetical protein [Akkermansiaceae bacterium]MBJ7396348.1 hypothetical protein [Akkermansiaceae bacterium]MBJ7424519.1 hypothetical protein [Akkermansiaceae bacterium]